VSAGYLFETTDAHDPGMVHAIAYHAIAPHVTLDAVNVVRILGIR
jgi:hypothetical protein